MSGEHILPLYDEIYCLIEVYKLNQKILILDIGDIINRLMDLEQIYDYEGEIDDIICKFIGGEELTVDEEDKIKNVYILALSSGVGEDGEIYVKSIVDL